LVRIERTKSEDPSPRLRRIPLAQSNPEGIEAALSLPDSVLNLPPPQAKAFGRKNLPKSRQDNQLMRILSHSSVIVKRLFQWLLTKCKKNAHFRSKRAQSTCSTSV
jgi:hypothetical protein